MISFLCLSGERARACEVGWTVGTASLGFDVVAVPASPDFSPPSAGAWIDDSPSAVRRYSVTWCFHRRFTAGRPAVIWVTTKRGRCGRRQPVKPTPRPRKFKAGTNDGSLFRSRSRDRCVPCRPHRLCVSRRRRRVIGGRPSRLVVVSSKCACEVLCGS